MSITTGLDAIEEVATKKQYTDRPKFFKIGGGETRMVRFVQELDKSHQYYDADAGLGAAVVEYRHPDDFRKRALSTDSEPDGKCWMAEQGWQPRKSLYILVEEVDGPDAGSLRILNQGFSKNTISESLTKFARENSTIRDRAFKISRTGTAWNDTSYNLMPIMKGDDPAVIEDVVARHKDAVVEWTDVLNQVPYEKQEAYFAGVEGESAGAQVAATPVTW